MQGKSFRKNERTFINCVCDCGNAGTYNAYVVVHGHTNSCGCFQRDRAADTQRSLGAVVKPGQRFGRFVTESVEPGAGRTRWNCLCDCGVRRAVTQKHLLNGNSTSCGCSRIGKMKPPRRPRSEFIDMPEYIVWKSMNQRCDNPRATAYANYGGRGIVVCERWKHSFRAFIQDMGARPTAAHSIDRIDNEGNYEPENCRWATRKEQANNRRPWGSARAA